MGKYRFVMHADQCINCKACENICKSLHDTASDIWLGQLLYTERENQKEVRFRACPQCNHAKCVKACPTNALVMRGSDGTVYVDADKCISGCILCQEACPHDLLWTDSKTGKTVKCDFCYDRVDRGLQPACVESCPTSALEFVERTPGVSLHVLHQK